MAASKSSLKSKIVTEFVKLGAVADGQHSWVEQFAEAIANAVVDEYPPNEKTESPK